MTNSSPSGGEAITAAQFNQIVTGTTQPSAPVIGDLWCDTNPAASPVVKVYGSAAYTIAQPQTNPIVIAQVNEPITLNTPTNDQTIVSFTGLSIPTTSIVVIRLCAYAVTSEPARLGLRINSTIVNSTAGSYLSAYLPATGFSNIFTWWIGRRDSGTTTGYGCVGNAYPTILCGASAAIPSAIITTIDLLGRGASNGMVLEYAEVLEIL